MMNNKSMRGFLFNKALPSKRKSFEMDTKYWIQNPSWVCNPQSNTLNGISIFGHKIHSVSSQEHKSNLGTKPTNIIMEGFNLTTNKNQLWAQKREEQSLKREATFVQPIL